MQLDEAVAGGDGGDLLARLVVGVSHLKLGLLGVAAVGVARLELLEHLDGAFPGAIVHRILGFGIELLGVPADGFVDLVGEAAAGEQQHADKR